MKFLLCFSPSFCFFCAFILWFHFITFALRKAAIKKQLTQAAIFYGLLLLLLLLTILTSAACSSANLRFFYKPSSPSISAPLHTSSEQTQMYCINIYVYPRMFAHTTQYKYINVIEYIHKWNQDFLYRNFRASRTQYSQAFLIAITLIAINTRYRRD